MPVETFLPSQPLQVKIHFPPFKAYYLTAHNTGISQEHFSPDIIYGYPGFIYAPTTEEWERFTFKATKLQKIPVDVIVFFIAQVLQFVVLTGLYHINRAWYSTTQEQLDRPLIHNAIPYLLLTPLTIHVEHSFINADAHTTHAAIPAEFQLRNTTLYEEFARHIDINTLYAYTIIGYFILLELEKIPVVSDSEHATVPALEGIINNIKTTFEGHISQPKKAKQNALVIPLDPLTPAMCKDIIKAALTQAANIQNGAHVASLLSRMQRTLPLPLTPIDFRYDANVIYTTIQRFVSEINVQGESKHSPRRKHSRSISKL